MQTRNKLLVVVCAIFCASCAVAPPSPADRVQVHKQNSTLIASCKKLGPVEGADAGLDPAAARYGATAQLKQRAYEMGADSVAIVSTQVAFPQVSLQGVALRCY